MHILTSKCASRHNGVQLFLSHLASWLRTRRFGEPTFRPSGATNHWKNTVLRDFPTFSRTCIFFLLTLSLLCSILLIQLCFSSAHIVGSLTSKLPSVRYDLDTYIHIYIYRYTYILYLYIYIYIYIHIYIYIYLYRLAFLYIEYIIIIYNI